MIDVLNVLHERRPSSVECSLVLNRHDQATDLLFDDGTYLSELCAALQAAYLASRYAFTVELATRYGLDYILCLRCTNERAIGRIKPGDPFGGRLCTECFWLGRSANEVREQQRELGPA